MRSRFRALVFFLPTLLFSLTAPLSVAAQPAEKKTAAIDFATLPSHVQFNPITVPIANANPTRSMVTLYLGPHDREKIGYLCRMAPRINDAVLSALSREPIPIKDRRLATMDVGPRLLEHINAAIGEKLVKEVHVLPGPPQAERGTFAKLPFGNAGGCKGISDMLEKLERQRQQEAAKR